MQLIAARAAMGIGAAVIFPTTLGLITNIFTDPAPRAKAIGVWAAMVGVGVAVGPISGGWLLEHFWWGSIFLVNIPIAVLAIIGGVLFVPTSRDPAAPRVDVPGLILSAAGITALVYTVIEAPAWGWTSARAAAGFALAAIVLAGFALWERRSTHPMLDISVFFNRRFSGGSLAVTAGFLTLFGFIFVITQYFQFIKNYSAFRERGAVAAGRRSIALASILGPRLVERVGTTAVVAAGLAVFAAGLAWASTADAATPYNQIAMQMLLLGGGLGLTTAPATEAIMGSLSADKAGIGSAVNDTTRELGGHPRRRHRRQHLRIRVLRSDQLSAGADRATRRSAFGDGPLNGGGAQGHRTAAGRASHRCPRRRQSRVPGRPAGQLAGLRGYRAGRSGRRRLAIARPGAPNHAIPHDPDTGARLMSSGPG